MKTRNTAADQGEIEPLSTPVGISVMVRTSQPRTERALEVVEHEIECTEAERQAFEQFLARLEDVEPSPPGAGIDLGDAASGGVTARAVVEQTPDEALREVRRAYRDTVMDVPHYETEYAEELRENMTAECGVDLATAIVDGYSLTPIAYEGLVAACETARDERETFLRVLRLERSSLREVRRTLDDIESQAVEIGQAIDEASSSARLAVFDDRLTGLESRCAQLSNSRQQHLHERSYEHFSGVGDESLSQFLYEEFESTCPALADIADCLDTVRAHRQRCLR